MRRHERAELLDRLCDLRNAYAHRGPDDRESRIGVDEMLEQANDLWELAAHTPTTD